jgi:hypothetical protein
MIGTRKPPEMIVMDSQSGKDIAHLATAEGMDGVYFDGRRKRVYVSGGRDMPDGFACVYQQKDANRYDTLGKGPTRPGPGTSLLIFSPLALHRSRFLVTIVLDSS